MSYQKLKDRPGYINPRAENIRGQHFSAWTVIDGPVRNDNRQTTWLCHCECGTERWVVGQSLREGKTKSCGCQMGDLIAKSKTTHGHSANAPRRTPEQLSAQAGAYRRDGTKVALPRQPTEYKQSLTYKRWLSMKRRVISTDPDVFKYYGGKGITVCEQWKNSYEAFLEDMGECPEGLTLDRKDGNGNYEPGNCRWATWPEQARNRSRPL